ncbi:MAG: biopolymer transporter ExbD [Bdellovibrionaceae bacterium]|nr:biopolymer transporter ExbD [Pseudobdellovibrionaceae bacterium]
MVGGQDNNDGTFELNLIPFIDILSTCICFLLISAVMIQVGGFSLNQATGSNIDASTPPPSVSVEIAASGDVTLMIKDVPGQTTNGRDQIRGIGGRVDANTLNAKVTALKQRYNMLTTVFIMPSSAVKYDDVIKTMQVFRDQKISQVGLVPLKNSI